MTVQTTQSKIEYLGTGLVTAYYVPFYFLAATDLEVVKTELATGLSVTMNYPGDYAVAGAGNPNGGTVTPSVAVPAGYRLTINRNPDLFQPVDYTANDKFPAETHEQALDRLLMQIQKVKEITDRAIKFPQGDSSVSTLTRSALRASKFLGFDAAGALAYLTAPATPTPDAALVGFTQDGVGAVVSTVSAKLKQFVHVDDFGAKGDFNPALGTGTGDQDAFNLAMNYLSSLGGGVVMMGKNKYRLNGLISIPANVVLRGESNPTGGFQDFGGHVWTDPATTPESTGGKSFRNMDSSLWICFDAGVGNGTPTYDVSDAANGGAGPLPNYQTRSAAIFLAGAIENVGIFQFSYSNAKLAATTDASTWNKTWNSGYYSGLAVRQIADDARIENCFIGGFMQAFMSYLNNRGKIRKNLIDCINGFELSGSFDQHVFDNNLGQAFAATGYSLSSVVRRGTFIYIHDYADWPLITNCFTYGHKCGYYLSNCTFPVLNNCGADGTPLDMVGFYGFRFKDTVQYAIMANCTTASREFGLHVDIGAAQTLRVSNFNGVACTNPVTVVTGNVDSFGWTISTPTPGVGTAVNNAGSGVVRCATTPKIVNAATRYSGNAQVPDGKYLYKAADYAMVVGDRVVSYDCSAASRAATLPAASSFPDGFVIEIVRWDSTAVNSLTINKNAADTTIRDRFGNNVNSFTMPPLSVFRLVSDGVNTWIMLSPNAINKETLNACATAAIAAGSTVYLGPAGHNANETLALWLRPRSGRVVGLVAQTDAAPGVGKNFTFTLRQDLTTNTAMVATITGAGVFQAVDYAHPLTYPALTLFSVKLVTDAGTPNMAPRVSLIVEE